MSCRRNTKNQLKGVKGKALVVKNASMSVVFNCKWLIICGSIVDSSVFLYSNPGRVAFTGHALRRGEVNYPTGAEWVFAPA